MEELQDPKECKPIGLCSTPPEAEQSAKDRYEKPPRYFVRIAFVWNGIERVIVEKYNHLREIYAKVEYWENCLQAHSIMIYKRLDL